ncbi:MAG TPA: acyl-CoA dehydrogenase family protein [Candidatus Binataceae bacterium]|nr:acyl-CoA dehydrogenase family protein [Candidatus Binataceae bacterium]
MRDARPNESSVVEAVRGLFPKLAARVEAAEQARRIPGETMDELHAAGFFRWFVPKRYGGFEWMPTPAYEVAIEMGAVCSSTAWVALLLSVHNHLLAQMDPRAQDDVWGPDPETLISSSFAPVGTVRSVKGGFELTGHWPFSSGVDHCGWAIVASRIDGEPGREAFFLVSNKQYVINDNWYVAGMKATGSKEIVVDHEFVPDYHSVTFREVNADDPPGRSVNSVPLYWIPFLPLFTWVVCVHAFGPALSAREDYRKTTLKRIGAYSGDKLRERTLSMARLAEASAEIDSALLLFKRDFAEMERVARERRRMDPAGFYRTRFDAVYALELCVRAVDRLWRASGAHALFDSSPVQRNLRDIHAMSQHGGADFDAALTDYGRFLLDPEAAPGGIFAPERREPQAAAR